MSTMFRRAAVVPILIVSAATIFAGWWCELFIRAPFALRGGAPVLVEIPKGEGANRICARLEDAGVVRSSFAARIVHRFVLRGRPLRAGEYEFTGAATPLEVLTKLAEGKAKEYPVTLREGLDRWQVAEELARAFPWVDPDRLQEEISDPSAIRDLSPAATDLEGYLFPESYRFARGTPEREIVGRLVRQFRERFEEATREAGPLPAGRSTHEVVVIASLVEAETGAAGERPRIAGVFANRLRIGMALQCDPTIIYALKLGRRWTGNIRKSDLSLDSPYNTYVRSGIPPGPIGNPGLRSIEAVLAPSASKELYFVSRNDGTHEFSSDYASHRLAVEKWQRRYWREKWVEGDSAEGAAPPESGAPPSGNHG
jgi:UPF0755 protein